MAKTMAIEALALLPTRTFRHGGVNAETVAEYAALMKAGVAFPPLTIAEVGKKQVLVGGAHRLAAATKAGLKSFPVEVVKVKSAIEAEFLCFRDNADHGLMLTVEDKRKAIIELLQVPAVAKMSNAAIARKLGVSDMTIGRYRDALGTKSPEAAKGKRTSTIKKGVKVDKGGQVEAVPVAKGKATSWSFQGGSWSGGGAETVVSSITQRVVEGVSPKSTGVWNERMDHIEKIATGLLTYAQSHRVS